MDPRLSDCSYLQGSVLFDPTYFLNCINRRKLRCVPTFFWRFLVFDHLGSEELRGLKLDLCLPRSCMVSKFTAPEFLNDGPSFSDWLTTISDFSVSCRLLFPR